MLLQQTLNIGFIVNTAPPIIAVWRYDQQIPLLDRPRLARSKRAKRSGNPPEPHNRRAVYHNTWQVGLQIELVAAQSAVLQECGKNKIGPSAVAWTDPVQKNIRASRGAALPHVVGNGVEHQIEIVWHVFQISNLMDAGWKCIEQPQNTRYQK